MSSLSKKLLNEKNLTNKLFSRRRTYAYLGVWEIIKCVPITDELGDEADNHFSKFSGIIFELEPSHPILISSNNSNDDKEVSQNGKNGAGKKSVAPLPNHIAQDAGKDQSNDSDENDGANGDFWNYANGGIPGAPGLGAESDDDSDDERDNAIILKNFNLNGDVIWHNLDKFDLQDCKMPFFDCCLFEYNKVSKKLRMSSASSLYFDFKVEYIRNEANNETIMMLKTENMISLKCRRISDDNYDSEYNFLNIYDLDFLTDVQIKASNGRIFNAHKSILWLTFKENTDQLLNKFKEGTCNADLIELILFYCYCDCLPTSLDTLAANKNGLQVSSSASKLSASSKSRTDIDMSTSNKYKSFLEFTSSFEELNPLNNLIKSFLNNTSFAHKTDKLIQEIKESFENINNGFKSDEMNLAQLKQGGIFANPPKLCQAIKDSFEQLFIAFAKLIRLIDTYSSMQEQLSKKESVEFIRKIKYNLPVFIKQLRKFLLSIYNQSTQLSDMQKRDLAEYLVPEIDTLVNFIIEFIDQTQTIIEKVTSLKTFEGGDKSVLNSLNCVSDVDDDLGNGDNDDENDVGLDGENDDAKHNSVATTTNNGRKALSSKKKFKNKLEKSISNIIHLRELKRMQKISEKFKKIFLQIEQKLQKFQRLNDELKKNFVHKELTNFIDNIKQDIPRLLRKLDSYSIDKEIQINKLLKLKDFKYAFKYISSKTMWGLEQTRANKLIVSPLVNELCTKLNSQTLASDLEALGLGPTNFQNEKSILDAIEPSTSSSALTTSCSFSLEGNSKVANSKLFNELGLPCHLESFYASQSANNNRLAKKAVELYNTKELADVLLEVHDDETHEIKSIKIHGALVGSRCMWFQRALNSGMKESIQKKMVLHDTNLDLFDKFIKYLYTGTLNSSEKEALDMNLDEIIGLLTFADKYECDSLKKLLEIKIIESLITQVAINKAPKEETLETLIDFANLSEQFGLQKLKDSCLNLLVDHVQLENFEENEELKQLPDTLLAVLKKKLIKKNKSKYSKRDKYSKVKRLVIKNNRNNNAEEDSDLNVDEDDDEDDEDSDEDDEDDEDEDADSSDSDEYNDRILNNIHNLNNLVNSLSHSLNQLEMNEENEDAEGNTEDGQRGLHRNRQVRRLMRYAWPLIVINPGLLETSYVQLKEILDTSDTQSSNWTDEDLVKLLIRNDYDLNRVIPIVLNIE